MHNHSFSEREQPLEQDGWGILSGGRVSATCIPNLALPLSSGTLDKFLTLCSPTLE